MKKDFYTEQIPHVLYALVHPDPDENYFYIGKTTSSRLSAIYSRHICSKNACTKFYFNKDDERPDFYLLEFLYTTKADAYKHVLAWIHLFTEQGYYCLNHEAMEYQAQTPVPETDAIIHSLKKQSFSEILSRTKVKTPQEADDCFRKAFPPEVPKAPLDSITQMNVRMFEQDKVEFQQFCNHLGITYREGFAILLQQANQKTRSDLQSILYSYQEKIDQLERERNRISSKLKLLKEHTVSKQENRSRTILALLKPALDAYFAEMYHAISTENILKPTRYKEFKKALPVGVSYQYPKAAGFATLTVDAIVWGKMRSGACFMMGTTSNGEHIKLRYYPKRDYIGVSIKDSPLIHPGTACFVVYYAAPDGAMDLVASFPLCNNQGNALDGAESEEILCPKTKSLDDLITNARSRQR